MTDLATILISSGSRGVSRIAGGQHGRDHPRRRDDPTIRTLITRVLTRVGYRVQEAEDGALGPGPDRECPAGARPDDLMMPGMKGDALITQVMQDPDPIPCILMSAYHTDVTLLPVPFLSKPFAIPDLERLVAAALLPPSAQTRHPERPTRTADSGHQGCGSNWCTRARRAGRPKAWPGTRWIPDPALGHDLRSLQHVMETH
jgi:CheY-like chemotaxis protein